MKKIILLLTVLGISYVSCQKNASKPWKARIQDNPYQNITALFKDINSAELKKIIEGKNETTGKAIVISTANKIASFFNDKYKIDISGDFIDNPEDIVLLGSFYAAKEKYQLRRVSVNAQNLRAPSPFDCFLAAVSSLIGITEAKAIWQNIVAGATEETVIGAVKLIGRRVGTVITVVIMIYEVVSCLDDVA